VAWVVPTYKNGNPLWRWADNVTAPLSKYGVTRNKSERVIMFPNGGFVGLYSADNGDSIRGENFHLVVIDEAAMLAPDVFTDAIMPTVADTDGDIILISTPKGGNWFKDEYIRALSDGTHSAAFHAPTSDNPLPNIQKAFMMVKDRITERSYRQEWLAEFLDDGGGVFRRVLEAATAVKQDRRRDGGKYVMGMDLAKVADYSVIAVIDVERRECVYLDRFNLIDYTVQLGRLQALSERFKPDTIVIESNVGVMFIELAIRAGLPVTPFTTTNASKQTVIDNLSLAFERGDISIINEPVLIHELQAYEMERLPSGMMRYNSPAGGHDDTVIALALAWYGATYRRLPDKIELLSF
jgi:phage terminase large subunit-like protein